LLVFLFQFFKKDLIHRYFVVLFSLFLYCFVFFNITYTDDWSAYELIFNGTIKTDFLLGTLCDVAVIHGYTFASVYKLHVFLTGVLFVMFIARFVDNGLVVVFIFILLLFVPVANQIRYFLAFALFLNSVYFLVVKKNKVLFVVFLIFSLLSHLAVVVLYLFILLLRLKNIKYYILSLFLTGIGTLLLLLLLKRVGFGELFSHFDEYLSNSKLSSFVGGVYNSLPAVFFLLFLCLKVKSRLKTCDTWMKDERFIFLYKLSLFAFVFVLPSFVFQILVNRYTYPFSIVWLMLYVYVIQWDKNVYSVFNNLLKLFLFVLFLFCYIYILPYFLFGNSESYERSVEIIKSIHV
jgi:hypothetical protein